MVAQGRSWEERDICLDFLEIIWYRFWKNTFGNSNDDFWQKSLHWNLEIRGAVNSARTSVG